MIICSKGNIIITNSAAGKLLRPKDQSLQARRLLLRQAIRAEREPLKPMAESSTVISDIRAVKK